MMKEKFLIDQLSTTNANLVDQIGRQQTHIEGLWEEIGFKNENIDSLHKQLMELNTLVEEGKCFLLSAAASSAGARLGNQ